MRNIPEKHARINERRTYTLKYLQEKLKRCREATCLSWLKEGLIHAPDDKFIHCFIFLAGQNKRWYTDSWQRNHQRGFENPSWSWSKSLKSQRASPRFTNSSSKQPCHRSFLTQATPPAKRKLRSTRATPTKRFLKYVKRNRIQIYNTRHQTPRSIRSRGSGRGQTP